MPVVTDKRNYFCGKQFIVDGLLERTEQCASLSCQIVEEQHRIMISYIPVCNIWQKDFTWIDTYPWKSFTCAAAYNDQCVTSSCSNN